MTKTTKSYHFFDPIFEKKINPFSYKHIDIEKMFEKVAEFFGIKIDAMDKLLQYSVPFSKAV